MDRTRIVMIALVAIALLAGGVLLASNFRAPDQGREANVADAPAGGRTQATPPPGGAEPIDAPGDPLVAGTPEAPDIPPGDAHRGLRKIGERIRDAVTFDGTIGDTEVPGVVLAGLTQAQRRAFLDDAVEFTCPCGCNQDLLECRRDDLTCPISPGLRDSLLAVARTR